MKIRSITYFCNPGWPVNGKILQAAGDFLNLSRQAFAESGYEVQTIRLATIPFPHILGTDKLKETPRLAEEISRAMQANSIDYASLGPALPGAPESYTIIPEALPVSESIFFAGSMTTSPTQISLQAVKSCAEIITACSTITPDGFANLRFAALANVKPGSPFFPAAYHDQGHPAFAIATEAADLAVDAFSQAETISEGQSILKAEIELHAKNLTRVCELLSQKFHVDFTGIDFSLAPFPTEAVSLGAAMERLGVKQVGMHGSLTAAAIITDVIDRAEFLHTGFCGLMLPVLEDSILAERAAQGTLTTRDLLLYSAVCGTGLDTVPLPGDVSSESVAALLLDIASLAARLNKPLTARLMPIPGKTAGDATSFDFGYFCNSRVMRLEAGSFSSPLFSSADFSITPRTP